MILLTLCAVFFGSSGAYYLYMNQMTKKPWGLSTNEAYTPSIAILVPVHNEEKIIQLKLKNLDKVDYAIDKTEIIIVDDASTDTTLAEIEAYMTSKSHTRIRILSMQEHLGKTNCMNLALKSVNAEVVVVSDADCFWPSNILKKSLPYLSDATVGAVAGSELLLNPKSSWVTVGEELFDKTVTSIRVGESKVYSTIFSYGGFSAYKRAVLDEFDHAVDDAGTALNLVQKGFRTLLLSEVGFYTPFPIAWKNKIALKIRRTSQLQRLWIKCLKLLVEGKLKLPKRIAIPEILLFVINPPLLVVLAAVSVFAFALNPVFLVFFLFLFILALLLQKTRRIMFQVLENNFIALAALTTFFRKRSFALWNTVQESRLLLTEEMLKQKDLI
jgi:cellulose synthase/poly-beta-1,6-N-acetylglucosamine synthase-like glycosyltransferase